MVTRSGHSDALDDEDADDEDVADIICWLLSGMTILND
jgi:hypothetical protein